MNTDQLVGKHILTGLTWTDARGKLLRRTEYHGIIVSAGVDYVSVWTIHPAAEKIK